MSSARPRLLHVITSLSTGGAEVMLRNVVLSPVLRDLDTRVVSLTTFEPVGRQLVEAGVPAQCLGARGSTLSPAQWRRLRRVVIEWRPDIVHAWMYHANVAVALALLTVNAAPRQIAAVRGAVGGAGAQSPLTRAVRRVDALLSRRYAALVFNSSAVRDQHRRIGYSIDRAVVIPNGFDVAKFRPQAPLRAEVRTSLGVGTEPLLGLVGRYHPAKGHRDFIAAAALLAQQQRACRFVLVGPGCDRANVELAQLLARHGITDRTLLLGERADMPAVLNALDVAVCASISESFPNAIGEAMACGVPCIVTDVGDCAHLVGDTGWVVPAGQPPALAAAMAAAVSAVASGDAIRPAAARARIEARFSLDRVAREYRLLYDRISAASRAPAH